MKEDRLIRFDWAMKRLLRHKADHTILNGFLSSLLGTDIRIVSLLESEGNMETAEDKFNRVDLLAENDRHEKILIEVQNDSEDAYFHRMLYGTSKLITEYINLGDDYDKVARVYSINIVYFNLGIGDDYVYTGKTEFTGLHTGTPLELTGRLKEKYDIKGVSDIFPQYYLLKANDFDRWSNVPLDQWMYFLSTSRIPEDATAPGLREAREQLRIDQLTQAERAAYYQHLDNMASARSVVNSARAEGLAEGRAEGRAEGLAEGRAEGLAEGRTEGLAEGRHEQLKKSVLTMRTKGLDDAAIADLLGESPETISSLTP